MLRLCTTVLLSSILVGAGQLQQLWGDKEKPTSATEVAGHINDTVREHQAASSVTAAPASAGGPDRYKHFYILQSGPPKWYCVLCIIAFACTGATFAISYRHIKSHMDASEQIGYGDSEMLPLAYGPRSGRVLHLLLLPPVFSVTAIVQMLAPGTESLMSLARTIQLSFAVMRLLEFMFLCLGGPDVVQHMLPTKEVKPYNAPPFCCCVCKKVIHPADIKQMLWGVHQFGVVAPTIGVLQVWTSQQLHEDATIVKIFTYAMTATTMLGMWSFKNLYNVIGPIMAKILPSSGPKHKQLFLLLQVISVKLFGMILKLCLKHGYDKGDLHITKSDLGNIITGIYLCVVQLGLTKLAMSAFPASSEMYPPPQYQAGCPLDMCAQMQLEGAHTYQWQALAPFEAPEMKYSRGDFASDSDGASSGGD